MVIKSCFALDMVTSLALASRWIRFETSLHRALQGPIDVFDTGKEPFLLIVTLIAVLVDGERPLLHITRVFQTTNGLEASVVLTIQIQKLSSVARHITAMRIAYLCGVKLLHRYFHVCFDFVRYPWLGTASLGRATPGVTLLGVTILRLFRALYLDHLTLIKHNGMFLRGSVREIDSFLLAHRLDFSDGILREV